MREETSRNRNCGLTGKSSILKLCLRDKVWKYRGEGNANLVIALPKERLILRLHKWERGKEITAQVEAEEERRVWREVLFCRSVMVPLLGSAYIQQPKLAYLDNVELIKLDTALKPLRPVYRLHKGIKFGYVTIYPDYALLPYSFKIPNHHNNSECYNHSGCKTLHCTTLCLLQSRDKHRPQPRPIENENCSIGLGLDEVSSKIMLTDFGISYNNNNNNKLMCHRSSVTSNSNCSLNSDSDWPLGESDSDSDGDDDIFIENYKNINKSVEIPSNQFYCGPENCLITSSQHLPISHNCSKRFIRGIRRFSTGSDLINNRNHPNSSSVILNPPHMVSSSAPVYSELILDMNNQRDPVFCVEIKPKQGWIPLVDRFNPKCTFCLNQYLKLSKGLVKTISRYCPLDLFCGSETRIRKALKNLLSTPQNNLKLFRDGVIIYSEDMKTDLCSVLNEWFKSSSSFEHLTKADNLNRLIDKFCHLVINALMTDLTDGEKFPQIKDTPLNDEESNHHVLCDLVGSSAPVISCLSSHTHMLQSCDWTSHALPTNCILDRILKIQQLEQYGADAIYKKFKNICPEQGDYEYVANLCSHPDGILNLDPVQRYLLATTAKDCSILIAFQRTNSTSTIGKWKTPHVMKDLDGVNYAWNIGISDLDPKPLSCIEKHRKRDADVISSCVDYLKKNT